MSGFLGCATKRRFGRWKCITMDSRKRSLLRVALLLYNEIDSDIDVLTDEVVKRRRKCSELFTRREAEGAYNLLVRNHLQDSELKFKEYFRFTREQFSYLANLIRKDCFVEPYNRVNNPISPEMKLAVTLR